MRKLALILPMLLLATMLGCLGGDDDDPVVPDPDLTEAEADSVSGEMFAAMMDSLENLEDLDDIQSADMSDIRAGLQAVLNDYPNHGLANLGMAAVKTMEVGADPTMWNAMDSLFDQLGDRRPPRAERTLGKPAAQQFRLITEAPLLMAFTQRDFPVSLTAPVLQRYIHDWIIPKVNDILDHIETAENQTDFSYQFEVDGDMYEIDLGEVYLLDALVTGLRAGLRMTLPYDLDLQHPTLGWDWILELGDDVEFDYDVVDGPAGMGDSLFTTTIRSADSAVLLMETLQHQLAPGSDFLALRTTGGGSPYNGDTQLGLAHEGLLDMLMELENAVAFIQAETDDQDDDIISIDMLAMLDAEIVECTDCPEEWEDIQSVIDWIETLLTEPFEIPLDFGDRAPASIVIDISAFFGDPGMGVAPAIPDWKAVLPYHAWRPAGEWVETDEWDSWWNPSNGEVWIWDDEADEQLYFTDIDYVEQYYYEEYLNQPIDFLDGPGGDIIDMDVEMPHLPDYMFGGIFPEMDRQDWEALLGWGPTN